MKYYKYYDYRYIRRKMLIHKLKSCKRKYVRIINGVKIYPLETFTITYNKEDMSKIRESLQKYIKGVEDER